MASVTASYINMLAINISTIILILLLNSVSGYERKGFNLWVFCDVLMTQSLANSFEHL